MIPGYVGGRCVKWLKKIWISEKENDSHYHIWDNRVLPSFVTEKDGEFAEAMFRHPDTACNEQNLNSVIVRPAQGEKIKLTEAKKGNTYRVQGECDCVPLALSQTRTPHIVAAKFLVIVDTHMKALVAKGGTFVLLRLRYDRIRIRWWWA